jgi:hypothetical protein
MADKYLPDRLGTDLSNKGRQGSSGQTRKGSSGQEQARIFRTNRKNLPDKARQGSSGQNRKGSSG